VEKPKESIFKSDFNLSLGFFSLALFFQITLPLEFFSLNWALIFLVCSGISVSTYLLAFFRLKKPFTFRNGLVILGIAFVFLFFSLLFHWEAKTFNKMDSDKRLLASNKRAQEIKDESERLVGKINDAKYNLDITMVSASNTDFTKAFVEIRNGSEVRIKQKESYYYFENVNYGSFKPPSNSIQVDMVGTNSILEPKQLVTRDFGIEKYFTEIEQIYNSGIQSHLARMNNFYTGQKFPVMPVQTITFTPEQKKNISVYLRLIFKFQLTDYPNTNYCKQFIFITHFNGTNYDWVPISSDIVDCY
jgi:hypothetical protein